MSKEEVLIMYPARPKAMEQLEESYVLHRYDEADDKQAFMKEFGPKCSAIVINGHSPLTQSDLKHLPNVQIVACSSAGFESIDVDALIQSGIHFTNSSDALLDEVADVALMLTLASRRQLVRAHHYVVSGDWEKKGMYPLLSSFKGKRAGIIGLGNIGKAIAQRFTPLGLEIGYTARSKKDVEYSYFTELEDLASWSDILVVAVPGGPQTDGIVDRNILEALGKNGTIVNIARGSVIDEPAMISALKTGKLGGAGLDVFVNEPNPDDALTSLPNVTLYPHHASGTVETRDAMSQLVVENLKAHFSGKQLLTPINRVVAKPQTNS